MTRDGAAIELADNRSVGELGNPSTIREVGTNVYRQLTSAIGPDAKMLGA